MAEEINYGFASAADAAFPPMTHVVITNACNLACSHCAYPTVKNSGDYKPSYLDWDIFTRIADEIAGRPGAILRFTCDGEPMLHPRFLDMAAYAKKLGLRPTTLNTNGTLLTPEKIDRLIEIGIDVVEVSMNSFSPGSYNAVRPGRKDGEYGEIVERVEYLIRRRNETGAKTKIMVSIIELPETEVELKAFEEYWNAKVDRVISRVFTNFGGLVGGRGENGDLSRRRPCLVPWRRMTVTSDGMLRYCFNDWLDKSILFDLKKGVTLEQAWNSPEMKKLRADHLALDFSCWPYCARCTTWALLNWNYDYGKALKAVLED
jgi:pyruvate-formate lyase-activating enzyme